jgi:hypothetical protein
MNHDAKDAKEHLENLIHGNCYIHDRDFEKAQLSHRELSEVFDKMTAAGYTMGKDRDYQNEWWPEGETKAGRDMAQPNPAPNV